MAESRPCEAYDYDNSIWKPATWLAWSMVHSKYAGAPCAIVEWPDGCVTTKKLEHIRFVPAPTRGEPYHQRFCECAVCEHLEAKARHSKDCACELCTYGGCTPNAPCGACITHAASER